jgi:hypothetical protein
VNTRFTFNIGKEVKFMEYTSPMIQSLGEGQLLAVQGTWFAAPIALALSIAVAVAVAAVVLPTVVVV